MNHKTRGIVKLEQHICDAETRLFGSLGADVEEDFLDLAQTRLRVRVLSQGSGPPVLLLHGASSSTTFR